MKKDYSICLLDSVGNFYGYIKIFGCEYNMQYVELLIESIIVNDSGSKEEFFENFSEHISNLVGELNKKFVKVEFEYNNVISFNVDNVRF